VVISLRDCGKTEQGDTGYQSLKHILSFYFILNKLTRLKVQIL